MLSCINIKITFENKSVISCPHCFSKSIYKYGKDRHGNQKYLCRDCYHQFVTIKKQSNKRSSGYPVCPICGRKTFLWHRYPHYIHFRCVSKKKHHSIKVPIAAPLLKKKSFSKFAAACFKRFRFSPQIILFTLILYFENACSLRKIKRFLLQQYHICVSHVSIWRWLNHFAAFFRSTSHFLLQNADFQSDEWHADETFIRIQGVQHYLWILLDSETRTVIAWHLSSIRDGPSAYHLFCCAREQTEEQPQTIITDGLASYEMSIQMTFPNVIHHIYESFADEKNNNVLESFNGTFKSWYKSKKTFHSLESAKNLITIFLFYYNFIHQHSSLNHHAPAEVAGVRYTKKQKDSWFLF